MVCDSIHVKSLFLVQKQNISLRVYAMPHLLLLWSISTRECYTFYVSVCVIPFCEAGCRFFSVTGGFACDQWQIGTDVWIA